MKRIFALMLSCLFLLTWSALGEDAPPLTLRVYVNDPCGGCGSGTPGCGECDEMGRLHGIVKDALGDRLYDGTMTYLMPNCRTSALRDEYRRRFEEFAVSEELYGIFPTAFLTRSDGSGVYLVGEALLPALSEAVDAMERGDDPGEIQQWIDALSAENAEAAANTESAAP